VGLPCLFAAAGSVLVLASLAIFSKFSNF
jgi:hypothetical protein